MLGDLLAPAFMQRALLAATVVGIVAGCVGIHVRLRRRAFVTDALTHTVFPGVILASVGDHSLFLGALAGALVSVGLLATLRARRLVGDDDLLAVVLTAFFAVGVVVASRRDSFAADIGAVLFGRILTVSSADVAQMALVGALALALVAALHKELVLRAFDPAGAEAQGYRLGALDLALDVAVALVVVTGFKAVGTLLVVALVVTPPAAAWLCTRSIGAATVVSVALAVAAGWSGLALSAVASRHEVALPPGATIVVLVTLGFVVVLAASSWRRRAHAVA
jgi:manganese/iron transport system permease protein